MESMKTDPAPSLGMHRFRRGVEARDLSEMVASLSPDVVFESPVVFKQYAGRDAVGFLLAAVLAVFEDFRYVSELHGDGESALVFKAKVGAREIHGIDLGEVDASGQITKLTVFVRPLSAATALRDAMAAQLGMKG